MRKLIIKFFFLFFSIIAFSQSDSDFKLLAKKYHTSPITDIVIDTLRNEIFTSDSNGQILVLNAKDYGYLRELKAPDRISISSMSLINEQQLLVLQKYYEGENSFVLSSILNIDSGKIVEVIKNEGNKTSLDYESFLVFSEMTSDSLFRSSIYQRNPFKKVKTVLQKNKVLKAVIIEDKDQLVILEYIKNVNSDISKGGFDVKALRVYNINTSDLLYEELFNEENSIEPLALVDETNSILLFGLDTKKGETKIYRYNASFKNKEHIQTLDIDPHNGIVKISSASQDRLFVNYQEGVGWGKCITLNKNGLFYDLKEKERVNLRQGTFNPITGEFFFFSDSFAWNSHLNGHEYFYDILVLDENLVELEKNLKRKVPQNYLTFFLPEDNWISYEITPTAEYNSSSISSKKNQIKYFDKGTFVNRFFRNDYYQEMLLNTGFEASNLQHHFIDNFNGKLGFETQKVKYDTISSLYSYDFIEDKTNYITDIKTKDYVMDYNGKQDLFLILFDIEETFEQMESGSSKTYTGTGFKYKVVNNKNEFILDFPYKYYGELNYLSTEKTKFSNDGDYICTITSLDEVIVYDWKSEKILYREKYYEGWEFKIVALGENDFLITGYGKDENKYKILSKKGNIYTESKNGEGLVLTADYKSGNLAILFNNKIHFNSKVLDYKDAVSPVTISLNARGTRLFVTLSDRSVELIDTASMQKLVTFYNFSDKEHLFYSSQGKYFANTDVGDYLSLENGNEQGRLNAAAGLYDPISILEAFGNVNKDYKGVLQKAMLVRDNYIKEASYNNLKINRFYVLENENSYSSKSLKTVLRIEMETESKEPEAFEIKINNVSQPQPSIKKIASGIYEVSINLSEKENKVEVTAKTKKAESLPFVKTIKYTGYESEIDRDLYVLSIGVSNYIDTEKNLTFADKDAFDIAKAYGSLTQEEINLYMDKFYAVPFNLLKNSKQKSSIRVPLSDMEFDYTGPEPLNADATIWLEPRKKPVMWDFNKQEVQPLSLHEQFYFTDEDYEGWNSIIRADPFNKGFYYNLSYYHSETVDVSKAYYYNFETKETSEIHNPFDYTQAKPLENGSWIEIKSQIEDEASYSLRTPIIIENHYLQNHQWNKKTYNINFNVNDGALVEILKISEDGNKVLTTIFSNDESYLVLLKKEGDTYIGKKIQLDHFGILEKYVSLTADGIHVLDYDDTSYDVEEENYTEVLVKFSYNDEGLLIGKSKTTIDSYDDSSLWTFQHGNIFQLTRGKMLAEDVESSESLRRSLENDKLHPKSFKNDKHKVLANEKATSIEIKEQLKSFFKDAKPQDQIVLFLAGHGMLDKELMYYYAPYDMNFEKVSDNGVSFEEVISHLSQSQANSKLLLMDTCHSGNTLDIEDYEVDHSKTLDGERGSVATNTKNKEKIKVSDIVNSLFDNFKSTNGVTVLSASSGQDVAYESQELSNGAFTTSYLEVLDALKTRNRNSLLDYKPEIYLTQDMLSMLYTRILHHTNHKQEMDIREINNLSKIRIW